MKKRKDERYAPGYPTWLEVMPEEDLRIVQSALAATNSDAPRGKALLLAAAKRIERLDRMKNR